MSHLLVHTTSGPVIGFQDTHPLSDRSTASLTASGKSGNQLPVNKWLGIPYAQATRWKRPTAPTAWKEPLECHEFGPYFPQPAEPATVLYLGKPGVFPRAWREQSEEKGHNLNIFVPDGIKADDKVPVMVWIYGGALLYGSACLSIYDPTEWIRREAEEGRKFIVVTGNYRVNLLGFLSSSELAKEDEDGLAGNYGAYDCIAYLRWVQENIARFGGDPDNVTAFGESAGGLMISHLLLCKEKLFQKAILQSGAPGTIVFQEAEEADAVYEDICVKAIPDTVKAKRIAALRALPVNELLQYSPTMITLGFVVEKSPKAIWTSSSVSTNLKEGKCNAHVKSIMMGVTKDEGSMFVMMLQAHKPGGYDFMCSKWFGKIPRELIDQHYQPIFSKDGPPDFTACEAAYAIGDFIFNAAIENCANTICSTTRKECQDPISVYLYRLNATVHNIEDGRGLGAFHSIDIPFLFNLKGAWEEGSANAKTSALMGSSWFNFAHTGCPDPTWPQYDPAAPFRRAFEPDGGSTIEDLAGRSELEKARYKFWTQFY